MMRPLVATIAAATLVFGGLVPAAADESGSIVVSVVDDTGAALPEGATVTILRPGMTMREVAVEQSPVVISGLQPGEYTLKATFPCGFSETWYPGVASRAAAETVTVSAGSATTASWRALAARAAIRGLVASHLDARPLRPVVSARSLSTGKTFDSLPVTTGGYCIAGVPPGDYEVSTVLGEDDFVRAFFTADGDPSSSPAPVRVGDRGVVRADFAMIAKGTVSGQITEASADGAEIKLCRTPDRECVSRWADADGRFTFPPVEPGMYVARVLPDDEHVFLSEWWRGAATSSTATPIVVGEGASVAMDWPVRPGGTVAGTVRDRRTGAPIETAHLSFRDGEGRTLWGAYTDDAGHYVVNSLPTGTYMVAVTEFAHLPMTATIAAVEGRTESLDIDMIARGAIHGTVRREDGAPLHGTVYVYDESLRLVKTTWFSDASGGEFAADQLDPGDYRLRFVANSGTTYPTWFDGATSSQEARVVHVDADATTRIDGSVLQAASVAVVRGRAVAADTGTALSGVILAVTDASGRVTPVTTGSDGRYEYASLRAEAVTIAAAVVSGYRAPTAQVVLPALGTPTTIDLSFTRTTSSSPPLLPSTVRVGAPVRAALSGWTPGLVYSHQWRRDGVPIRGAVGASYTPTSSDRGRSLTVVVVGTRAGYATATQASVVRKVSPGILTAPAPKITGTRKVGRTLTAVRGTWTAGTTLTYRWYANGKAIKGATKAKYKLTARERGDRITVKVTGHKAGYTTVSKISARTERIAR